MNNAKCVSTSFPLMRELCCMEGKLNIKNEDEGFYLPAYTSRKLIKLLPEVIAMPSKKGQARVLILTTEELFDNDNVKHVIAELGVEFVKYTEVSRELYKDCLVFTMSLKITPSWNAIGTDGYYVRGEDFLTSPIRSRDAVRLFTNVTAKETGLLVMPVCFDLPRLTLQHFGLPACTINSFMESEDGIVDFGTKQNWKWVYILPSLKRGRVMRVTKRIAQTSPIKTYEQMKEHWLNMYDFKLPETEDGMIYFQLWFPWTKGGWSYPYHCLSPISLVKYRYDGTRGTAGPFLDDLLEKMPEVCGNEVMFNKAP